MRTLITSKRILLTITALLLINLPWIALFINVSKVGSFVQLESSSYENKITKSDKIKSPELNPAIVKGKKEKLTKENFLKSFRENILKINPFIILFAIPSIIFINWKITLKLLFSITSAWLFILSTVVSNLKPQLELDRMMVILSLLLCIPIGSAVAQIFKNNENKLTSKFLIYIGRSSVISMLVLSVLTTSYIFQNRSWEKYKLFSPHFLDLAKSIKSNKEDGRTLFAGFILHEFEGSHIAPLTYLSNSPIIASSPVHNLWKYTDIIPEYYRQKGPHGIEEYLDLYNVSLVIAHEKPWKEYFRQSSFRYDEIEIIDRFVIFKRNNYPNTYFYKGEGNIIQQGASGIKLKLKTEDAIFKFNYLPFLKTDKCEIIEPFKVNEEVIFIRLRNCDTDQIITIKSISPLMRLLK